MRCIIERQIIDISLVNVDAHGFGKFPTSVETQFFVLEVEFSHAIEAFGPYYNSFIAREQEDEGFDELLSGDYLNLSLTGYMDFESMLRKQPKLIARVIRNQLATEFMGYIFHGHPRIDSLKKHILQTLESVAIGEDAIRCTGRAFVSPRLIKSAP